MKVNGKCSSKRLRRLYRVENRPHVTIAFPCSSKQKFDELRGTVATTIPKHHFYKAVGGPCGFAVDFAENLLEAGVSEETVADTLNKTVLETWRVGAIIRIEHVKLNGSLLVLTPGKIM